MNIKLILFSIILFGSTSIIHTKFDYIAQLGKDSKLYQTCIKSSYGTSQREECFYLESTFKKIAISGNPLNNNNNNSIQKKLEISSFDTKVLFAIKTILAKTTEQNRLLEYQKIRYMYFIPIQEDKQNSSMNDDLGLFSNTNTYPLNANGNYSPYPLNPY